jgi:hypothetical protein
MPIDVPASLPAGYAIAGVLLTRVHGSEGITVTFRQTASDLDGAPIQLHLQRARALPPAPTAQPALVALGATRARWTPDAGELEWVSGGVYRSLVAPGLDLDAAVSIASSIPTR